jgi:hypothetical protein
MDLVDCSCGKKYSPTAGHSCGDNLETAELRIQKYELEQKLQVFEKTRRTSIKREDRQEALVFFEKEETRLMYHGVDGARTMNQTPPTILKCNQKGHPHFDVRNGCPMCPRGEELLRLENEKLRQSVSDWKEAWHRQREATGKVAWQYLDPWMQSHLEHLLVERKHVMLGRQVTDWLEKNRARLTQTHSFKDAALIVAKGIGAPTDDETIRHIAGRLQYGFCPCDTCKKGRGE